MTPSGFAMTVGCGFATKGQTTIVFCSGTEEESKDSSLSLSLSLTLSRLHAHRCNTLFIFLYMQ